MASERSIQRTSQGVPRYDGTPELFPMYKEEALQFLMTFEYRKRYLAGPRLASELEGTARMAIRTMTLRDPQWISHPRGVYTLLEKLESVVSKPSLVEGSRYIMKFFYNLQRRKQETMTSWIARHRRSLVGGQPGSQEDPEGVQLQEDRMGGFLMGDRFKSRRRRMRCRVTSGRP